jgi:hypothetical protein
MGRALVADWPVAQVGSRQELEQGLSDHHEHDSERQLFGERSGVAPVAIPQK